MKDVLINIIGRQIVSDNDDTIEFTTIGTMEDSGDKTLLKYDESEIIGIKGVLTTVSIAGNKQVHMQRSGALSGLLLIEHGKRHLCHYGTVAGDMVIGIFGESVICDVSADGVELSMAYTIDVNMGLVSRNEVKISVKEVKS